MRDLWRNQGLLSARAVAVPLGSLWMANRPALMRSAAGALAICICCRLRPSLMLPTSIMPRVTRSSLCMMLCILHSLHSLHQHRDYCSNVRVSFEEARLCRGVAWSHKNSRAQHPVCLQEGLQRSAPCQTCSLCRRYLSIVLEDLALAPCLHPSWAGTAAVTVSNDVICETRS